MYRDPIDPRKRNVWMTVVVLTLANLVAYVVGVCILGGDAVHGARTADQYFNSSHGKTIEVSSAVCVYSFVHTIVFLVSIPIAAGFGFWALKHDGPRN